VPSGGITRADDDDGASKAAVARDAPPRNMFRLSTCGKGRHFDARAAALESDEKRTNKPKRSCLSLDDCFLIMDKDSQNNDIMVKVQEVEIFLRCALRFFRVPSESVSPEPFGPC
jgi:hypothetical protein